MSALLHSLAAAAALAALPATAARPWLFAAFAGALVAALYVWRRRLRFDVVAIAALTMMALAAPWLAAHPPRVLFDSAAGHPLGLDRMGRDLLARGLFGLRQTLGLAAAGAAAAAILGGLAGGLMGAAPPLLRRFLDALLQAFFAVPALIFYFLGLAFLEPGPFSMILLFSLTLWPETARMVQADVQRLRRADFVEAARMQGRGEIDIFLRELTPNLWPLVLAGFLTATASAVLLESILGYLGLGLQVGAPSLGNLLEEGAATLGDRPLTLVLGLTALIFWIAGLRSLLNRLHAPNRPLAAA